jgi:hypothetical protein
MHTFAHDPTPNAYLTVTRAHTRGDRVDGTHPLVVIIAVGPGRGAPSSRTSTTVYGARAHASRLALEPRHYGHHRARDLTRI